MTERSMSSDVYKGSPEYTTTVRIAQTLLNVAQLETQGMELPDALRYAIGGLNTALIGMFSSIKADVRLEAFDDMVKHMRRDIEERMKAEVARGRK